MKKLINAPDQVVTDALRGMRAAHGDRLRVSFDPYMVVRADAEFDNPFRPHDHLAPFGRRAARDLDVIGEAEAA